MYHYQFRNILPYSHEIMDPLTISALIMGVGSLIGSGINLFSQSKTNKTQRDMMREQNEFNRQQTLEMNRYNSYANQKSLMEQAGLNPAFLFGSGGLDASQGSAAQGAAPPSLTAPQIDLETPARQLFEAKRLQNETLRNDADIDKIIAESETFKIANQQAEERFNREMDKLKADTHVSEENRKLIEQQLNTEKAKQIELSRSAENLKYNSRLLQQKAISEGWSRKKIQREIEHLTVITPIEAKELQSRYNLNEEQANLTHATLGKIQQEIRNLISSGRQIDALTLSQILDNQLKDAKIGRQIEQELLKNESPVLGIIYDETSGMIGDIVKTVSAFVQGGTSDQTKVSSKKRSKEFRYQRTNSSWLFE